MKKTTKNFLDCLEEKEIKYQCEEREGKSDWVCVRFSGNNAPSVEVQLFFHEDEEDVALRSFSIVRVPQAKTAGMLTLLNSLMEEYRWLRLYLDEDNEVTATIDAVISADTAGPVSFELLMRMVGIVDDIYPRLMKELWA